MHTKCASAASQLLQGKAWVCKFRKAKICKLEIAPNMKDIRRLDIAMPTKQMLATLEQRNFVYLPIVGSVCDLTVMYLFQSIRKL